MPFSALNSSASLTATLSIVDAALGSIEHRLPAHISRDDLASAGKLALVEALLRFAGSPEEVRAYCFVRVRGAILDELRRLDPLSRHTRTQITSVRRTVAALERDLGRAPTAAEISAITGISTDALAQLDRLAIAADTCSSDETDAEGHNLHSLVEDDAVCPATAAESVDAHATVHAALARLSPKHAHVLRRYYLDDLTLDVIAEELGISKERVRQLRESAEKKLREDFIVLALWQSVLNRR